MPSVRRRGAVRFVIALATILVDDERSKFGWNASVESREILRSKDNGERRIARDREFGCPEDGMVQYRDTMQSYLQ